MWWIHWIPAVIPRLFPQFLWHHSRNEKVVYLTFDDGPVPGATDFVLAQLEQRNMKATFFMVGENVDKNPKLAQQVIQKGHQIGNHTQHHLHGFKVTTADYLENTELCQETIKLHLGIYPTLFRPPYGQIKPSQWSKLGKDFTIVMWDVLSGDFDLKQSAETCLKETCKHTKNGSIVIFHDQQNTAKVIKQVLPDYLDFISAEGYTTKTL